MSGVVVYHKVVKMAYCAKCKGKHMADVEVTATNYGEDTFIKYKTLNCPCYGESRANHSPDKNGAVNPGKNHQMPLL
jgi:hypothetical protein